MKKTTKVKNLSVFDLKISEKEKYDNDGKWFKNYMSYIVRQDNAVVDDYETMKLSYEIANNNLEGFREKLNQFCNPLGEYVGEIEEEVVPYPELHNKINILKGEMLDRSDEHKIMLLSAKAVKDKNDELYQKIQETVSEKLAIALELQKQQLQGLSQEEQQQFIAQLKSKYEPDQLLSSDWMSGLEIFYSKALQFCKYDQDIKMKQMDTFEDTIIADRFFVYSGWKHGRPFVEIRNPLFTGWHKGPNERVVQKGSWVWYKKAITPDEVLNNYNLTEDELATLGINTYGSAGIDQRHNVFGTELAKPTFDQVNQELLMETDKRRKASYRKDIGLNMTTADTINRQRSLIWETHFEFKAFKELIFLSYVDEYNEKVVTVMSGDFNIPDHAVEEQFINLYGERATRYVWFDELSNTEFTAEKLWIPRKYEIVRLGSSVYPIYREVPYQHTNIEQPYSSFELSTKGAVFNARNSKSVSLLQRALSPYFQLLFLKHIQNRELAKYQSAVQDIDLDQIPDALGQDVYGNPIRDKVATYLIYLKRTNKSFYSGSQNSLGGLPPATRSPGSSGFTLGSAVELMNLQQLIEYVKREIGMAMGISPQREASFSDGSNVSDNRQAITQSYHITEPYFFLHSEIWKSVLNDWLINFRTYCQNIFEANPHLKEHSIHYFLPDGTAELLKVTPEMLRPVDIGLFITHSGKTQKYTDYMLQLVHAFAQNAGEGITIVSGLIKDMVTGASPEEIHKRIQIAEQKQFERMQQTEQMKTESQKQQIQMQIDAREDEQSHEIDLVRLKAEEDRKTKLQVATIQSLAFEQDQDMNQNQIPDVVDIAKLALEEKKLDFEKEKFKHEKEYDAKDLQIKAKKSTKSSK